MKHPPDSQYLAGLLRLLRTCTGTVEISGLICLADNTLERLPSLTHSGRGCLMRNRRVHPRGNVTNGLLNEGTLGVSRAEEGQVDHPENKASLGEGEDREGQTDQESHFQSSDKTHAGIVVLLDESADSLRQRRLLGTVRASRRGRLDGGDQVGARVGSDVEDGVDAEREEGQGDLARVQPQQSHT